MTLLILMLALVTASFAQVKYHAKENVNLSVSGTSSMHDWDMKSSKGESNVTFTMNAAGQITGLSSLSFVTLAKELKSEHSAMDKNAYKALKTSQSPIIAYNLTSATLAPDGTIKCQGKLTIAGVTKDADLAATSRINPDKSITIKGSKKISMQQFDVAPPTFMMGAVKTGNDVTISFDITYTKQ
ncbi:YceI family protein [Chitinophaga sp. SYP-B3965]|uniref:YceI family protein n=1 Tax=Chitinophaga sp. SYP-B3965 TaxID=2663120 RepID=UPI00156595C5|nr:YceI family protein [Chitinophaga sp. SYP-B3965]